MIAPINSNSFR